MSPFSENFVENLFQRGGKPELDRQGMEKDDLLREIRVVPSFDDTKDEYLKNVKVEKWDPENLKVDTENVK